MWRFWDWSTNTKLDKIQSQLDDLLHNQKLIHTTLLDNTIYVKSGIIKTLASINSLDQYVKQNTQSIRSLIEDVLLRSYPRPMVTKILAQLWELNMSILVFNVNLPPKAAPDVVARQLTVVVNGDAQVMSLGADVELVEGLKGPQDSMVTLMLVDIDDSGNSSPPSELSFVLLDTIPPPQPGSMGATVVAEIFEEPVAEEPVAEEPVVEEPVAEEPVAEEPVAEEPVAEEPENPPAA